MNDGDEMVRYVEGGLSGGLDTEEIDVAPGAGYQKLQVGDMDK